MLVTFFGLRRSPPAVVANSLAGIISSLREDLNLPFVDGLYESLPHGGHGRCGVRLSPVGMVLFERRLTRRKLSVAQADDALREGILNSEVLRFLCAHMSIICPENFSGIVILRWVRTPRCLSPLKLIFQHASHLQSRILRRMVRSARTEVALRA